MFCSVLSLAGETDDQKAKTIPDSMMVADSTPADTLQSKIVAYYIHQTKRCPSCRKIEAYTDEAITSHFADQLESGDLEWQLINIDIEGNEHYMDDYQLFTKSVILSRVENGKEVEYKNLKKIWELLNNKEKFIDYIESEITTFMKEK
jgi:hypothetical protein